MNEYQELVKAVMDFNDARGWERFHSPKNLAMALMVEAAELGEHFQWMTEDLSRNPGPAAREYATGEIADVFIYLLTIADALGIDPVAAAHEKLIKNGEKYPVKGE